MITIFFIRHGQTLWNKELKYQGHSDIELSEEGLRQAEQVAARLRHEPFSAIYSSDLSRAVVTAKKVASYHSLPITVMPVPFKVPTLHEVAQWHPMRAQDACLQWLVKFIQERATLL